MDPSSIGANLATFRDHLEFLVALLVVLPAVSFLLMKFWIAGRSARVPRTTNWVIPDLESESAPTHHSMQQHSVAFAHQVSRNSRHAVAVRNSSSRRSA
jgi:hypothetical protein